MAHSRSVLNLSDPQDDHLETTIIPSETPEHVKSSAPASDTEDAEDAPLLLNHDSNESNLEAQTEGGMVSESKKGGGTTPWRRCFGWVLGNIMFVIAACLLAAGAITLCVYFGGNQSHLVTMSND